MEMVKYLKLIGAAMAAVTIHFSVQATPVTAEQAARAARSWIRGGRSLDRRLGSEVGSAEAVTAANGAAFHVVKVKDGGFVVMSADTTIEPVIAFSSSGELRNDPRNPLWALLTGDLAARAKAKSARLLSAATSSGTKSTVLTGPEARWAALLDEPGDGQRRVLLSASTGKTTLSDVRVDALVKSAWSQEDYRNYGFMDESNYCYNYYTPEHWPCGCVATVGAQIMRYHRHPSAAVTPATYSCAIGGTPVSLTMQGGVYDWNSMTLVPADGCTAAARRAIGKLTSDVGIACGMEYFSGGSSSPVYMLTKRFVDRFQYANAVGATFARGFYSMDFSYTLERFKSAVIPNFDAGLPVALGISGGGYGHAVVGDGYGYSDGNFYVHINLGWADLGGGDAWYMPPDIDDYDTIDSIVYNIYPQGASGASLVSGRILTSAGAAVAGATVTATAAGGAAVSTASDARGFYALKVPAGTYGIRANKDDMAAELTSVTVGACVSTAYSDNGSYSSSTVPQIGNVYGQDFVLSLSDGPIQPVQPVFRFDGNGADSGSMADVVIDVSNDFPLNRFVRDGYSFLGWSSDPNATEPLWTDGEWPDVMLFDPGEQVHVLYAVWAVLKLSAVSASNAFIDGSVESPTWDKSGNITKGKVYTGEYISFYPDETKGYLQSWTVKPATLLDQLGEEARLYSSLGFPMPAEAVTVTANMVAAAKCGAFVTFDFVGSDTNAWSKTDGAAWSPDKGKTWIPAEFSYPLATGTYTIKFRAPDGWVAPGDLTLVVGKPKSGVDEYYNEDLKKNVKYTWYEPTWIWRNVLFYPESETRLTTLKFDGAGGKPETAQVSYPNRYVFENGLRPLPAVQPRSGYAFDGWWTAKVGGEEIAEGASFDPMKFDPATMALYAHWKKTYTVTLGGADMDAYAYEESEDWRYDSDWANGKGSKLTVVGGAQFVDVSARDSIFDAKGNELVFQKWTVSPSSAVMSGDSYDVQSHSVTFLMPESNLTLTPTYVDAGKCGRLCAYARSDRISLGWDEEKQEERVLEADNHDMQWSPDGGKTWYCNDDPALLPAGTYTVQWRSASPMWQAPTTKTKVQVFVDEDSDAYCYDGFSFVPVLVVDPQTPDGEIPTGCTVTMNPKDGCAVIGKTVTLTAKDTQKAKDGKKYVFQGWSIQRDYFPLDLGADKTLKFDPSLLYYAYSSGDGCGNSGYYYWEFDPQYLNLDDLKVHVTALFKALEDYTQEDLIENFRGVFGIANVEPQVIDDKTVEMTVEGMTGCSLSYYLDSDASVGPITFKNTAGKLPKGLKFDAKTGEISGVPTAKGGEKATCVFTITDPAANVLTIRVNFMIRPLQSDLVLAGDYRSLLHDYGDGYWDDERGTWVELPGKPLGLLEMSVTSAGKVSAKLINQGGSTSLSGTLTWYPDDEEMGVDIYDAKKGYIWGRFGEDGTMTFDWEVLLKNGNASSWLWGPSAKAHPQNLALYGKSSFVNKYYTFSFGTTSLEYDYDEDVEKSVQGGYGYLTVKTDAKGVAKVAGQLPDGTAISANAAVLPYEGESGDIQARLFFFNAPSAYKKNGWCAMSLELQPDGVIRLSPDEAYPAAWFAPDHYGCSVGTDIPEELCVGAFYSPAETLENHYWFAECKADSRVNYEYEYKEDGYSWIETAWPMTFGDDDDEVFFSVELAGDKKGSVALAEKSPAPWKDKNGEWNYWEDKNGNPITDPSQLSISFTKATGVFSGKSNVYFDYYDGKKDQHQAVSVPYAGVMVMDPELGMMGLGSAVYSSKRTESSCLVGNSKKTTYTQKISLPVELAPIED